MDLAKIRKKAREEQNNAPSAGPTQTASRQEGPPQPEFRTEEQNVPFKLQEASVTPAWPDPGTELIVRRPVLKRKGFDPVAHILAGREAAGCNEEQHDGSLEQGQQPVEEYDEFLCIRVADEIYGINIMQIKEIIKPRQATEVPRAPAFVAGVISLRGVITPIIDLQIRLGLETKTAGGRERIVVVKHGSEFCGLMVDEVTQVVRVPRKSLESAPAVLEGSNRDFVSGIGRTENNRMIILLNLAMISDTTLY